MIRNSLICKLINVQASMKENNEKKINNEHEISKLIKAFPKDIAALDKRSVLAKSSLETTRKVCVFAFPEFIFNHWSSSNSLFLVLKSHCHLLDQE